MPAAWLKWTAAGVWKPRPEWRCWWLYHWKKRWQNARPSSMEPNCPGNSGRDLSVLNCASEYGLSLEQCGREWLLVTPKSASSRPTGWEATDGPRAARRGGWSAAACWLAARARSTRPGDA